MLHQDVTGSGTVQADVSNLDLLLNELLLYHMDYILRLYLQGWKISSPMNRYSLSQNLIQDFNLIPGEITESVVQVLSHCDISWLNREKEELETNVRTSWNMREDISLGYTQLPPSV